MHGRLLAAAAALAFVSTPAFAGSKIFSPGTTAAPVNGSVEFNANLNRDPWVAQVFSEGGACLRIAVQSQGADLEATLVSPSGRVWQDDDSGGSNRPLIKAQTDVRGWYPLVLSHWSGATVNSDFNLTVQRNTNASGLCTGPTPPRILAAPTSAAAKTQARQSNQSGGAND